MYKFVYVHKMFDDTIQEIARDEFVYLFSGCVLTIAAAEWCIAQVAVWLHSAAELKQIDWSL